MKTKKFKEIQRKSFKNQWKTKEIKENQRKSMKHYGNTRKAKNIYGNL